MIRGWRASMHYQQHTFLVITAGESPHQELWIPEKHIPAMWQGGSREQMPPLSHPLISS